MRVAPERTGAGGRAVPGTAFRRVGSTAGAALLVIAALSGCAGPAADPEAPAAAPSATASAPSTANRSAEVPIVRATPATPRPPVTPVRLRVASRDVEVPVVPVGVREDGGMALPEDPAIAGWYRYGPGLESDRGTVVVAAHVDSLRYGLGPFVRIRDVQEGARIRLEAEDGGATVYRVSEVRRYEKRALPVDDLFERSGEPRLVLVTCGGPFDDRTRTYRDNIVVIAERNER